MSYHSKIYHKFKTDRKSDRSHGCNSFSEQEIFVGRSKNTKYRIGNVYTTCMETTGSEGQKILRYEIKFNGEILNVVEYDLNDDLFSERHDMIPNYEEKRKLNITL